jgi:hypothetical protein
MLFASVPIMGRIIPQLQRPPDPSSIRRASAWCDGSRILSEAIRKEILLISKELRLTLDMARRGGPLDLRGATQHISDHLCIVIFCDFLGSIPDRLSSRSHGPDGGRREEDDRRLTARTRHRFGVARMGRSRGTAGITQGRGIAGIIHDRERLGIGDLDRVVDNRNIRGHGSDRSHDGETHGGHESHGRGIQSAFQEFGSISRISE